MLFCCFNFFLSFFFSLSPNFIAFFSFVPFRLVFYFSISLRIGILLEFDANVNGPCNFLSLLLVPSI